MNKLNFLLLSIVLFSCNNNEQGKDKLNKNDSLESIGQIEVKQQQIKILDFKEYWKEFGGAIQTNDTNKIKLLVDTPLNILGREDQDPHLKINTNEIIKFVMLAVNNGGYYDSEKDVSISNKTLLLSDLKSISEYKPSSDNQWINDFVFKKTTNGWKLVTLYMDTKGFKAN